MKQNVNYVNHHRQVNLKMSEDSNISPYHISVYNALFQIWNECHFDTDLSINRNDVMKLSKIGNANTYTRILKQLDEQGYIKYKPSFNPLIGSKVTIIRYDKGTDKGSDRGTVKSSSKGGDKGGDTLYKQVNNKTIKQEKPPTPKGEFPFKYDVYLEEINKMFGRNHKVVSKKLKRSIQARLREGYKNINFLNAMINVKNNEFHKETNYVHVDPYFFAQESKLSKYGDKVRSKNTANQIGGHTEYLLHD